MGGNGDASYIFIYVNEVNQPTSGNSLPPKKEGRPGLDGVTEDGAVVVHPRFPGHRGSGLCHLGHLTVNRGTRGTWKDKHFSCTEPYMRLIKVGC